MRILQFDKFGDPTDVIQLKEVSDLHPEPDEIRIRMTYFPINPSDLFYVMGEYGIKPKLPAIPGFEGTGYIDELGANMNEFKIGQRVVPLEISGTWKEQLTLKRGQFVQIPDEISDQTAAQLTINPLTAWILCIEELNLKKGDWLLQTAAGSTLGRIVLQISKMKGFKTVNFVRRRAQVNELLELGADAVICTEDKDVVDQVMRITEKGAHAGIDAVGGQTGALALQSLRKGGILIVYGLMSLKKTPIDTSEMIFKETTIRGFWLNRWFQRTSPDKIMNTFKFLLELMANKQVLPPVDSVYNMTEFKDAIRKSLSSGRQGKVLVKIN